jgi:hypothetical protein
MSETLQNIFKKPSLDSLSSITKCRDITLRSMSITETRVYTLLKNTCET